MLLRPRNLVGLTPLLLLTAAGWAAVLNVPAQYATIQAAIGAAQNNDEIVVAPGTYAENINFGGKTLNVHSSGGAAVTTIDGRNLGSAVAINNNEPAGTACTGFTITRGGMFLGNGTHATVRDCIFRDNTGSNGPALIMEYANALVRDCTFRDNIGDGEAGALRAWGNCQPTLRHCTFLNNRAHPTVGEGNAGAVRLDDAGLRITLEDCLFQGNSAGWAGVLDIRNRNAAVLRRCRFVGNTARVSAGAVAGYNQCRPTFEDCEFLANSVQQDWGGAATFGDGSRPTMLRCRFEANTASTGGAIVAYDATTLATVTDSVFTGNTAEWEGGALLVQWSATLVLSACRLEGNSAMWGGALHCHAAATLSLRDSVLRGNSARDGGGAILVHDWGTATLTATDFSDNTAQNNGGAVWVGDSNTNTQISACYFARNTTSGGGGAVHGRDGAPLDIQDSTFAANSAWTGGAVYVCCNGILTLAGAYFADNYAADTGGALYADGQYSQIQVRDADFVNNGSWMGGAVQFSGLTEPLLQNCFLVANSATGVGGAVRSESCTNLRLLGCVLVANRAGDLGGGIAFWGGTQTAQIANCTIADNQAVVSSGGLANGNSANVIALSNCILDGNVVGTSPSQIGGDPVSAAYSLIRGGYGGLRRPRRGRLPAHGQLPLPRPREQHRPPACTDHGQRGPLPDHRWRRQRRPRRRPGRL
jgi:predicted outer membrane repeat protein